MKSAYWQIPLDDKAKELSIINTHKGLFMLNRLQMGMKNASAIFQRCVEQVLKGIQNVIVYQDDIMLFADSATQLKKRLSEVKKRLRERNFTFGNIFENTGAGDIEFTKPLDDILAITQKIHQSKRQTSSENLMNISAKVNEMKNRIINVLLPLVSQVAMSKVSVDTQKETKVGNIHRNVSYADITKKKLHKKVAVVVKSGSDKKVDTSEAFEIERKITNILTEKKINATLHATIPKRNGDVVMMFDDKDNAERIADNIKENLGIDARGRSLTLPKITITHIPQYIDMRTLILRKQSLSLILG
jgi:hypothetical protein